MYEAPIHSEKRQANLMRLEAELSTCQAWLKARPIELFLEISSERPVCFTHALPPLVKPGRKKSGFMRPGLIERLEPIMETVIRILIVGEGDPLANPHFPEMIDRCLRSGAEVSFATLGDRLTPGLCRRMVKKGLAHIQFSIDAATEERYAMIHRGGRLGAVLDGLRALSEARRERGTNSPLIDLGAVLMRCNASQAPDLVRMAAEHGADRVLLRPLDMLDEDPQAREFFRHEFLHLDALQEAVDSARAEAESLGVEVLSPVVDALSGRGSVGGREWQSRFRRSSTGTLFEQYAQRGQPVRTPVSHGMAGASAEGHGAPAERQKDPIRCTQPWTTLYVRWNGDVLPCHKNTEGVDHLHAWSEPLEVWNGRQFRALRKRLVAGDHPRHCHPCMESLEGRDIIEEFSRIVMPVESTPEAEAQAEPDVKPDPGALVLGLGFSKYGTSIALTGGGLPLVFRPMENLTGMVPCRFISRLSPASMRGEFYLEDGLFRELLENVLNGAGGVSWGKIQYLAYNPDSSFTTHLPGGRNPALENLFPGAAPLLVDHHRGHMALAFFTSPFKAAAILVADDAGLAVNRASPVITVGRGEGKGLEILHRIQWPHNPGALFYAARVYLGLGAREEGLIAEMAAKGTDKLHRVFSDEMDFPEGEGFRFRESGFLAKLSEKSGEDSLGQEPTEILEDLFGPKRIPGSAPDPHHLDVAHAVIKCLCDILVRLALFAHKATGLKKLCLSGHTGLSECLEKRILEETPIKEIHVPMEPAGLGLAAGNALAAAVVRLGAARPTAGDLLLQDESSPSPEEMTRFRKTAIATLRHQHERLVWAWRAEKASSIPPDAARALELLVRQNERLLAQRAEHQREILDLRKKLAPFFTLKGIKRKVVDRIRGLGGSHKKG
jgi:MoaA/NifB/PqqE/SkfB family radical SAM enzyme